MDGLTSLAGLSSLTTLESFVAVDNQNLVTLVGADKLTSITGSWREASNPSLGPGAAAAFSAQVGLGPCDTDDPSCICYQRPEEGGTE